MTTRSRATTVATHGAMILLVLTAVVPVYWMIVTAFRPEIEIFSLRLLPQQPTLENFAFVLTAIPMLKMLGNTFVMAAATALAQILTGLFAAYALTCWRFPGGKVVQSLIALSWLVPFQVTMIPNYVLSTKLGLLNTTTGLVLPNAAAAFAVLVLVNAMKSFPRQVIEAARMDDAGHWRILWEIIVPNLRPAIASLGVLAFISAWNEYFWPLLLIRKIEDSVVQIGLQMFMTQEGNQWGPLMAAATLASLPVFGLYLVLHRQVIDSFMKSGLK
ncbi:carbohydrate ABC transporter permease [Chachezhania sediminis]|uniref:carbohydrate ABC transporter permease n=1 Tax=Chachezhania sediminis TaxID=2599291 RepID=UPI00131D93DD|nr:carbohydrate ABC transporter permease [Chachezhania sediminis]